ncbi:MAG: hypothetical protein ACXVZX_14285 [Terriglobales bacterium]
MQFRKRDLLGLLNTRGGKGCCGYAVGGVSRDLALYREESQQNTENRAE